MNKKCRHCGGAFIVSGPSVVYCAECSKLRAKKTVAKGVQRVPCRVNFVQFRAFVRHNGQLVDLGYHLTQELAEAVVATFRLANPKVSQGQYGKDHRRTTGIGYYMSRRREVLLERKDCNRCDKHLLRMSRYEWCVHHVDHDRTNNVDSNFELLCKRCHQIEHCSHDEATGQYTQRSTTISQESTPKQVEAVGTDDNQ